jgi:predicted nuclease of predicted toxin-antitoxin system
MKFIVDESTGTAVVEYLETRGFDVVSVHNETPGIDDYLIVNRAFAEERIIITNDKDFGELVYRQKLKHKGVMLLRLEDERASNKIAIIQKLLSLYSERLKNNFIVVTENRIRIRN